MTFETPCIYNLLSTTSRKCAYADDLALLHISEECKTLEANLSQNRAVFSAYLKTCKLKLRHAKGVTAAFHLRRREAKREFEVYANGKLLSGSNLFLRKTGQFTQVLPPSRDIAQKLSTRVTLLRRLADSGRDAAAKTLCTGALSLVYSTAEYCSLV